MDIELGSVHAIRNWRLGLNHRLPSLFSMVRLSNGFTAWPYGILEAKCARFSHDAPSFDCTCGIYVAVKDYFDIYEGCLFGGVELFGKIIEHEYGYRAQYARITHISPLVLCCGCRDPIDIHYGKFYSVYRYLKHGNIDQRIITGVYCEECWWEKAPPLKENEHEYSYLRVRRIFNKAVSLYTK